MCARFEDVLPIEHIYPLVRSERQLTRVLEEIENAPGVIIHTIVDVNLRNALEEGCRQLRAVRVPLIDAPQYHGDRRRDIVTDVQWCECGERRMERRKVVKASGPAFTVVHDRED